MDCTHVNFFLLLFFKAKFMGVSCTWISFLPGARIYSSVENIMALEGLTVTWDWLPAKCRYWFIRDIDYFSKHHFLQHVPCRGALHKNDRLGYWCVACPSDEPVVYRTQRYRHDVLGERPIQFQQFIRIPTMFHGIMLLLGMAYFALLSVFSWTRNLLFKVSNLNADSMNAFVSYRVLSHQLISS